MGVKTYDQVTSAPRDVSVSIRTAVCIAIDHEHCNGSSPNTSYSCVDIPRYGHPSMADLVRTLSAWP